MEKVFKDIREIVEKLGFTLYDVIFEKNAEDNVLSVLIDSAKGIDIDDCVKVSGELSEYLDREDPIDLSYTLEVSSAGAERLLRTHDEMVAAIGKYVHAESNNQHLEGILKSVTKNELTIKENNNKIHTLLLADITLIRLAIDF